MAAGDYEGLIEACMRLGDASRGGDPQLWSEVLEYFGSQQSNVTQQVGPRSGRAAGAYMACRVLHAVSPAASSQQSACIFCRLAAQQARL